MAEATAEAAPAKGKKGGGKKLVLVLVGALVLLGGGAAGAYFTLSHGASKHEKTTKVEKRPDAPPQGEKPGTPHAVLSLEPFIVNLADSEGDRYVKYTMRLVLDRPEAAETAKDDDLTITRIRDRVLTLLSSKTFAQVATPEGKESLRREIQKQVNTVLRPASVSEVYYTEFIVQ